MRSRSVDSAQAHRKSRDTPPPNAPAEGLNPPPFPSINSDSSRRSFNEPSDGSQSASRGRSSSTWSEHRVPQRAGSLSRSKSRTSAQGGHLLHIFNTINPFSRRDEAGPSNPSIMSNASTDSSASSNASVNAGSVRKPSASVSSPPSSISEHQSQAQAGAQLQPKTHAPSQSQPPFKSQPKHPAAAPSQSKSQTKAQSQALAAPPSPSQAHSHSQTPVQLHVPAQQAPPSSPHQYQHRRSAEYDPMDLDRGRSLRVSGRQTAGRSSSPSIRRLKIFPLNTTAVPERLLGRRSTGSKNDDTMSVESDISPTQAHSPDLVPPMPSSHQLGHSRSGSYASKHQAQPAGASAHTSATHAPHAPQQHPSAPASTETAHAAMAPARRSHRDYLRHVQLPKTAAYLEKTCFLRVYRSDGTFGTIACSSDINAANLLQLAARKFFISNSEECRLVALYPSRVRVLTADAQPALLIRNLLVRAGYHSAADKLSDVIRDDTSFLCRIVLVHGSESLRPPLLLQQGKHELVLIDTDVTDAPSLVCGDSVAVDTIDVSRSAFVSTSMAFPRLKRLKLSNMFAPSEVVPHEIAFNLQELFTNLIFLDLSCNGLTSLDNLELTFAPLLRHVDLRGNRLTRLPDSLMHLPFLQVLECGTNQLAHFSMWNPSLHKIGLSYNLLTSLELSFEQARQMIKLTSLQLCANSISAIPETLQILPVLRELDVRHNILDHPIGALTPSLTKLVCSYNNPRMFEPREAVEARRSVGGELQALPRLLELRIDNMSNLEFYEAYAMAHIAVLDMSNTNLPFVHESLFIHAPNLRVLNLASNSLTVLPEAIVNLRLLEELYVSRNSLVDLPNNLWMLPELRVLDAHANNLKSVSMNILHAPKLKDLNLASNLLTKLQSVSHIVAVAAAAAAVNNESIAPSLPEATFSSPSTVGLDPRDPSNPDNRAISPLVRLILCDNQLSEDAFEVIFQIPTLQYLDLSYNYLTEISPSIFQHLPGLEELYLAGNCLSTLPHDGFALAKNLQVLRVNGNRLHTLPAELSKATKLEVLDAGANQLRYNVANFPFDWNWRWNKELRYLNFSANRRLEIRKSLQLVDGHVVDLADFCVLPKLATLGLMDVTLTTNSVPFESNNCRVRTFGSDLPHFRVGIADSLGFRPLATNDLVVERFRNNENESLIAMFDGHNELPSEGNKISNLAQEIFPAVFKRELQVKETTIVDALRRAFLETHREIGNNTLLTPEEISHTSLGHRCSAAPYLNASDWSSGTGATVIYHTGKKIYIATVGGARVVLSRANGTHSVLSKPLPPVAEELDRIRASGGVVDSNTSYVNGISQFPRLIGCYTAGTVFSAAPSIYEYDVGDMFEGTDQIIVASSAMWNVMGHETAADIARSSSQDAVLAAMKLRDFSQAYGCSDRIMAMVIGRPQSVDSKRRQISDGDIYDGESLAAVALRKRMEQLLPEDSTLARLGTEVSPPFGDVTMVFTDIRNSTYLWETYPPVMRSAIKTHNSLMRRSIRLMDGYEVKNEGDAFIISFHTPIKALIWCLTVQQHLLTAEWPQELLEVEECAPIKDENGNEIFRGLSVRMGIHCGRPVAEPDPVTRRMDYFGPMVNRASRISGVAQGGQISVSADFLNVVKRTMEAHEQVLNGVPIPEAYSWTTPQVADALDRSANLLAHTKYTVREFGELKLRGIENLEHIYNIYPQMLAVREHWYAAQAKKEAEQEAKEKEKEENIQKLKQQQLQLQQQQQLQQLHQLQQQQQLQSHILHNHRSQMNSETTSEDDSNSMFRRDSNQDFLPTSPPMPGLVEPLRRHSEVSLSSLTSSGSSDMLREQMLRELMLRKQMIREQMREGARVPDVFDPFQSLAHRLEALCVALSGGSGLKAMQQTLQTLEPPVLAGSDMADAAREVWLTRIENAIARLQQFAISGQFQ